MSAGTLRTPLALAVDVLWGFAAVAIVVAFFGQGDGPAPSILSVAAVVVASFVLARVLQPTGDETSDVRTGGMLVSLALLFVIGVLTYSDVPWDFGWLADLLSQPASVIEPNGHVIAGMATLTAFWIRGVRHGTRHDLDFDALLFSVSLGFAAVVIAALATPAVQGDISWGALAFAYSIVALAALAVFNTSPRTDFASMANGWPLAIGMLALAALALALVAGTLDRDAFDVFSPLVAPSEAGGRVFGEYVLTPIQWMIWQPFRLLRWILEAFFADPRELEPPRREPAIDEEPRREPGEQPLWFRVLFTIAMTLGAVAIGALVLFLLWQAFRRYVRRRVTDPREQREDIEPASSLAGDLASLIGALGRRFRRGEGAASSVAVRRLYFDMLSAAEERGLERSPSLTPLQFAPALDAEFASDAPSAISAAFVESRYAGHTIDEVRVRMLRQRWRDALRT
ncbi:MAG: DUF4129 domain-containing protein [Dehalococcoidia bacterium]